MGFAVLGDRQPIPARVVAAHRASRNAEGVCIARTCAGAIVVRECAADAGGICQHAVQGRGVVRAVGDAVIVCDRAQDAAQVQRGLV